MTLISKAANAHAVVATGWTDPSNAFASSGDNVYATTNSTSKNAELSGDFSFPDVTSADIPDGATIVGVKIRGEWGFTAAITGATLGCQPRLNGANAGSELTKTTTTEAAFEVDVPGVTLADLRAASTAIKARIRSRRGNTTSASTFRLDYVLLEVEYSVDQVAADAGVGTDSIPTGYPVMNRIRTDEAVGTDTAIAETGATDAKTATDAWVVDELANRTTEDVVSLLEEDFSDDQAAGWVSPDVPAGGTWIENVSADVYKSGGVGRHRHLSDDLTRSARIATSGLNVDFTVKVATDKLAAGANQDIHVAVRMVDGTNYYRARLRFKTDQSVWIQVDKVLAAVTTPLGIDTQISGGELAWPGQVAGTYWWVRVQAIGENPTTIKAKAWPVAEPEPTGWHIAEDASELLQSEAGVGVRSYQPTGTSNLPVEFLFDDAIAMTIAPVLEVSTSDSGTLTEQSTVSATIAKDSYATDQTPGLPNAEVGGAYTVSAGAQVFSAGGRHVEQHTAANQTTSARLASVSAVDHDMVASVATNKLAAGANQDSHFAVRMIGSSDYYRARLRFSTGNRVLLQVSKVVGGVTTDLTGTDVDKGAYAAGDRWWVRTQAIGTGPTTVRARAWKDGTSEPSTWDFNLTDSEATLQAAGHVGLRAFQGAATTNTPIDWTFDDLLDVAPGTTVTAKTATDSASWAEAATEVATATDETLTAIDTISVAEKRSTEAATAGETAIAGVGTFDVGTDDAGALIEAGAHRGAATLETAAALEAIARTTQLTDTAAASENATVVSEGVNITNDAGSFAEAVSHQGAVTTDAAIAAEFATAALATVGTDAAALASETTGRSATSADAGAAAESLGSRDFGAADQAAGSEATSLEGPGSFVRSDAGAAADASALAAAATTTEAAGLTEGPSTSDGTIAATDVAAGADVAAVQTENAKTGLDAGILAEATTVTRTGDGADAAVADEVAVLSIALAAEADSAAGMELVVLAAARDVVDPIALVVVEDGEATPIFASGGRPPEVGQVFSHRPELVGHHHKPR